MTVPMMPPAAPAVGPRTAPGKGASSARAGHAADDSSNGSAEGQAAAESFAALLSSVQQPPVQPTPPQNPGTSQPDGGGDGQDHTDGVNHLVANLGMTVKELVDSVGPGEVGKLVRAAARPAGFSGGPDAAHATGQAPAGNPTQASAAQTAAPAVDPSVLAALEAATTGTLTAADTTDARGSSAGHRQDDDAARLTALGTVTGSPETGKTTSATAKLRAEEVSKGHGKGLATDLTPVSADKPAAGAAERAQAFTASMPTTDDVRVIASTSASKAGRTGESDARRAEAPTPTPTTTFALPPTTPTAAATPTTPVETVSANPNAALHEQLADPVLNVRARGNGTHLMIVEVHPESLGPVQIEVRIESGTTSVTVSGGAIAQDALRAAMPELHAELRAAGINDLNLNLGSSTQHQNHNPNQNNGFGFDAHSNNGQHNGWGAGGSGGSDRGTANPSPRGTGHGLTDDPATTTSVRPTRTGTLDRAVDRWL